MTSSPEPRPKVRLKPDAPKVRLKPDTTFAKKSDDLPPALSSMWRLCKLGYSHEPGLLLAALALSLLSALPDALLALWFKLLGDGVLNANWRLVRIAAVALGVS